jgi:hypothetical protein
VACGGQPGPTLQELQISPSVTEVTENLQAGVAATAVYSDGSTRDVTAEVAWSTVDATVATADAGVVQGGQPGSTYLTASFGGLQASARVDVAAAQLLAMWVSADAAALPAGVTGRVAATGSFSDGTTRDVTAAAAWMTTRGVVEVRPNGEVKALSPGFTQVRATIGNLMAGVTLEVTAAEVVSLSLDGVGPMPLGLSAPFHLVATFTDGTSRDVAADATVDVADAAVVALDGPGALKALAAGLTGVTASYAGLSASAQVQVGPAALASIAVGCSKNHVKKGDLVTFSATGSLTDGTTQDLTGAVTWLSADAATAEISTYIMLGAVLAREAGTVTITALDPVTQVAGTYELVIAK